MVNRPAMGVNPPLDTYELLQETLLKVAPKGLDNVQTMMCGSCSVENAVKAAMIKYRVNVSIILAVFSVLHSAPPQSNIRPLMLTNSQ